MERVAEYLRNAGECLVMADKATEPLRSRLLEMSKVWSRLAAERETFLNHSTKRLRD